MPYWVVFCKAKRHSRLHAEGLGEKVEIIKIEYLGIDLLLESKNKLINFGLCIFYSIFAMKSNRRSGLCVCV